MAKVEMIVSRWRSLQRFALFLPHRLLESMILFSIARRAFPNCASASVSFLQPHTLHGVHHFHCQRRYQVAEALLEHFPHLNVVSD